MMATMSATIKPSDILDSPCRLTNEGGRMRTRYGLFEPSLTI